MLSKCLNSALIFALSLFLIPLPVFAVKGPEETFAQQREQLFHRMESITQIPWYYLAAVDRYESNTNRNKKEKTQRKINIIIPEEKWSGEMNPMEEDISPESIAFFGGIGRDGNGDGKAERTNDEDVLFSLAIFLSQYGFTNEDVRIGLWNYYLRDRSVDVISEIAKVFHHYGRTYFTGGSFPIPVQYNYSYHNTWGDARGWGGRRIHEGTDIFADYGTPVRATRFGVIEVMGWNKYGGWRVGIRDLDNIYHYYAHLSSFNKKFKIGDIVEPGNVIGYVGSSGYGKPGTSGKFPPHLHYGMYRDNGKTEWSFDPYPHLKKWEREEYQKKRKKK